MKRSSYFFAALVLAIHCPSLHAASITIANPSFESPAGTPAYSFGSANIDGWGAEGPGVVGVWNIIPGGYYTTGAPVGSQIAWVGGGAGNPFGAAISQVLSTSLQPSTIYSLTGFVGHPLGLGPATGTTFTAQLFAGTTLLSSITSTGSEAAFSPFTLNFDSTGSSVVGQPLKIRLSSNQPQVGFDGIALNAVPTPEPSTAMMLLFGATLFFGRNSSRTNERQ